MATWRPLVSQRASFSPRVPKLTGPVADHVGRVYELGGDTSMTFADLAAAITAATGQTVVSANLPADEHHAALVSAGVPEAFAKILVDVDQSAAGGALEVEGHEFSTLMGRPTTSLTDAVSVATATAGRDRTGDKTHG